MTSAVKTAAIGMAMIAASVRQAMATRGDGQHEQTSSARSAWAVASTSMKAPNR